VLAQPVFPKIESIPSDHPDKKFLKTKKSKPACELTEMAPANVTEQNTP
jgi:hypothetical protein